MKHKLKDERENNKRLVVGYLDENSYTEYPGYITSGIFEAAKKYDLNIIRFGHFDSHNTNRNDPLAGLILDHIQQYSLDGLMFLGWARAATMENHSNFRKHFDSVPLFSIGAGFPDIPHTYFPGDICIREILCHLIDVHHFRRIAFIAPFWPDARSDVYISTMKEYGIYDPGLYISETVVAGLEVSQRGKKAVSILLDEREIKVEAIVSLYNDETKGLIEELHSRGLNVPGDIAVTSYEDGAIGRFSSPALTTVYFPYMELGFASCEKMAELLRKGSIPQSNLVPGKVIWRESCGCMPISVTRSAAGSVAESDKPFGRINRRDLTHICKQFYAKSGWRGLNAEALLDSFMDNFNNREKESFLKELEAQLSRFENSQGFPVVEDTVSILRRLVLPYFVPYIPDSIKDYFWFENLFQQAQLLVLEKKSSIWAREEVQFKSTNFILQQISQKLVDNFSVDNLMDSLESNLPLLNIPSCYIFIFKNQEAGGKLFDNCILAFEYCNHTRVRHKRISSFNAKHKLTQLLFPEDRPYLMMAHLLHAEDKPIGFVLFEPGPMDDRIYQTLAIHISTALNGAMLLKKLEASYKGLIEQAHRKGMADIASGILHNVGNILSSIDVSIHLLRELVNISPVKDLLSANSLLEKNMGNIEDFICHSEKGKKLMKFYISMDEPIKNFQAQLLNNIKRLTFNINSIQEIITAQDSYAGFKCVLEEVDVLTIIDDALKMCSASYEKRNIRVVKDYEYDTVKVKVQKTKLFHVLVNLMNNAKEAMHEAPEDSRVLSISVLQTDGRTYIRITDTGCGIPPDLFENLFTYGFTTKKEGHGFGLHSCANYMNEMGGRIWAESEGAGKGATFVLQL